MNLSWTSLAKLNFARILRMLLHSAIAVVLLSSCNQKGSTITDNFLAGIALSASTSTISVTSSTVNSGSTVTVTLTANDQNGHPFFIPHSKPVVIFSTSGGTSTGSFNAVINNQNGTYTTTFTGLTSGTATQISATMDAMSVDSTAAIRVIPGNVSLTQSTITLSAPSVASSSQVSVTLHSVDTSGNPITQGGLSVAFSQSTGAGLSTGHFSSVTDNNDGTYSATFTGIHAGLATSIAATIGGASLTSALPVETVLPGPATLIAVQTGNHQSQAVNQPLAQSLVALVTDANSNVVPGVQVDWSITTGTLATLSTSSVATDSTGAASTTLTLGHLTGNYVVTAQLDGNSAISTSFTETATPGPINSLSFAAIPTTAVAGTGFNVRVQALDQYGNTKTDFTGGVHFASSDVNLSAGDLPSDYVFQTGDNGIKQFSVKLKTSGNQTLTVSLVGNGAIAAGPTAIAVTSGTASQLIVSTQPVSTRSMVAIPDVVVKALDAQGNRDLTFNGSVNLSLNLNASSGTLTGSAGAGNAVVSAGTASVVAVNGIATFHGLLLNKVGSYRFLAASTGLTSTSSSSFQITYGPPNSITIADNSTNHQSGTVDQALALPFKALVTDLGGNIVPGQAVDWAVSSGSGSLSQSQSSTDSTTGIATSTLTFGHAVGATSVSASVDQTALSVAFTATSGPSSVVSSIAWLTAPALAFTASSSAPMTTFKAELLDADGNLITTDNSTNIVLSVVTGTGSLGGTVTATAVNGVATFSTITYTVAETLQFKASVGTSGSSVFVSSGSIIVHPGQPDAAHSLIAAGTVSANPDGVTPVTITMTLKDAFGNLVAGFTAPQFASTGSGNALTQTSSLVTDPNGQVQGSMTSTVAELKTLSISSPSGLSSVTTTLSFVATNVAALHSTITTSSSNVTADGTSLANVTILLEDASGNPVQGITPSFAASGSGNSYNACSASNGSGVSSCTFTSAKAETKTLSITGPISQTGSTITFINGVATKLVWATQPSGGAAGSSLTTPGIVWIEDAKNNLVTTGPDATANVTLAVQTGGGSFNATPSVQAAGGVADFSSTSLVTTSAGQKTIRATKSDTSSSSGPPVGTASTFVDSNSITITPLSGVSFRVAGFPTPVPAGQGASLTVTALDTYGNTATGYTGSVQLTSNDSSAVLPTSSYTFTVGSGAGFDNGVHTFSSVTLVTQNSAATLTATDTSVNSITGTQSPIVVNSTTAVHLAVTGFPSPSVAGAATSLTVTALDTYGNIARSYRGSVSLSSSSTLSTLPSSAYTFTVTDNGVHTFSGVSLNTIGSSQSISATDTASAVINGTESSIIITPAPAATLSVNGFPTSTVAGQTSTAVVTAYDSFGNIASGYTGAVGLTTTSPLSTLPLSAYTFTSGVGGSFDNGSHTFTGLSLNSVGSWSLAATDTVTNSIAGSESAISVAPSGAVSIAVSGFPVSVTAGVGYAISLSVYDAFGNLATGFSDTVHFNSSDSQSALPSDYTFTSGSGLDNGTHLFTGAYRLKTAGAQSVTATDTTTNSINGSESSILVYAAAADHLIKIAGDLQSQTAGQPLSVNSKVEVVDLYGNPVAGTSISFAPSAGSVSATPVTTDSSGFAQTSWTLGTTSGAQTLTAARQTTTLPGTPATLTFNETATPASVASLIVSGFPTSATAGSLNSLTVKAVDAFGNTVTGYTGTVTFATTSGLKTLPADYTFTSGSGLDNGVHTFSGVSLKTAGTQSISATDNGNGSVTGTESSIVVSPASAATLTVAGIASSITAGASNSVTVSALDAYGNVATGYTGAVAFATTSTSKTLPANYTFTSGSGLDNGVHTFNGIILKTAGTQSVTATDTVTTPITGTESSIVVNPASAMTLTVSGFPSSTTAGTSNSVTVTALDSFGNTASGYTGTVNFTTTSTSKTLPANYTFTSGSGLDNGAHTFTGVILKTTGMQSITATDTVTNSIAGSETGIVVASAPAATLALTGFPTTSVAGSSNSVTVQALDSYGNQVTGYIGTINFTTTSASKTLPANYTFTSGSGLDNGAHTFTGVILKTSGTQSITATDTVTSSITGAQVSLTVNPAGAATLTVTGIAANITAGSNNSVTVTALDSYGNTASGYTGTIAFSTTSTLKTLPANYTFTSGSGLDNGSHTFSSVSLKTSGTQSVTATDTITNSITGVETSIVVTPASPASLTVSGIALSITAGFSNSVTVTALDSYGNQAPSYTGTVGFTTTSTLKTLPANYTFTSGSGLDNGAHTFSGVVLKTSGTQSITATDTVTSTITGTESSIVVSPSSGASITVAGFPVSVTAGVGYAIQLTVLDSFGNVATGFSDSVHFSSSDLQAVLPGDYTFTTGSSQDNGSHLFTGAWNLRSAGAQSVTATSSSNSSVTGTESSILVYANSADHLIKIAGDSQTAVAGQNLAVNPKVEVVDLYGNAVSGTSLTFTPSAGSVGASPVASDSSGFASTSFTLGTLTGSQTLTVSRQTTALPGSPATVTFNETATPAAAAQLVVSGFPASATAGSLNSVTVQAVDQYGNTVTGYTGTVSLTSSSALKTLPPNYTFTSGSGLDNGSHTFTGVSLKTSGTQSITATDTVTSLITGLESPIVINPAAASTLTVTGISAGITAGSVNSVTVTALDAYGNLATGYTGTTSFTTTSTSKTLPANYTFTAGSGLDNGAHTFTGVVLKTAGQQSVTVTDTVTTSITGSESSILVSPAAAATLTVSGFPGSVTAGSSNSLTVTAVDAFGNTATGYTGSVFFTTTSLSKTLPANYTFTSGSGLDNGAHTFTGVILKTTGTQSINATDTVTGSITGLESGIVVSPSTSATLALSGFPASSVAGSSNSVTVQALDSYGNVASGYTGTINFTTTSALKTLPANYTFTSGSGLDNGSHTFTGVTLKTSGTQSLTAADTVTSSITGTQSSLLVTPAAATTLTVTGIAANITAGSSNSATVTALDAYGNTASGYTGSVSFTTSSTLKTLPSNYTFTSGSGLDNGAHTFTGVVLKTSGTQSVTVFDTVTTAITGSETSIVVSPAAGATLTVAGFPTPVTAGSLNSVTLTALDAFGNTAAGYTGTVSFTTTSNLKTLPANYTFTSGSGLDNGSHTFTGVTLKTSGTQSINATDTLTSSITGSESSIVVNPAGATSLTVTGIASSITAGSLVSPVVTALDTYGNVASGYTGTVSFTTTSALKTLPSNYTFTSGSGLDNGVHTFTSGVALKTAGTQSVTATDTVTSSITGIESSITVNAAAADHLIKVAGDSQTQTAGSGVSVSPKVQVVDLYGNPVSGTSITFTPSAGSVGASPVTTDSSGYAQTSFTLGNAAGSQTLTAARQTTSLPGTPATVTFNETATAGLASATTSLIQVSSPTIVADGNASVNVTITLLDQYSNPVSGASSTFASSGTGNNLTQPSGTTNASGVITGTIKTTVAESKTLSIATPSGLTSDTTTLTASYPTLSIASASANEGSSLSFTVTLSSASTQTVTVGYASSNGTALSGTNYTATSGTLTIPAGSTTGTITVPTIDDTVYNTALTMNMTLSSPVKATIATASSTGTINNVDSQPSIVINDVAANEGSNETFTVSLSNQSYQAITVAYATSNGTAVSGTNYTAKTGTLTIPAFTSSATVSVSTVDDGVYAASGLTFNLNLSSPTNATIADNIGIGTINNIDGQPSVQFTLATQSVNQSPSTQTVTVAAQLSAAENSNTAVTIPLTLTGTATSGTDYTISPASITIAGGATTGTTTLTVVNSGTPGADKTATLTMGTPTNASLGSTTAQTVTIVNNNFPTVSYSVATQDVAINQGTATVTVNLSAAPSKTVMVPITISGTSTAVALTDYTLTAPTLTFTSGVTTQSFTYTILDQASPATANATLVLGLGSITNGAAGGTSTQTSTIRSPSLDLNFAAMYNPAVQMSQAPYNQITFTRASTATYMDCDGVMKTAAINVPRIDCNAATGQPNGLLIEESRTNSILQSQVPTSSNWSATNAYLSSFAIGAIAPDGTTTSFAIIENTAANQYHYIGQNTSVTSGVNYCMSGFLKASSDTYAKVQLGGSAFDNTQSITINLTNGAVTSVGGGAMTTYGVIAYPNSWYRAYVCGAASATGPGAPLFMLAGTTGNNIYTGNGTSGIYFWGAQFEQGAFPTSYIPTTTVAATRAYDNAAVTNLSWFTQGAGTLYTPFLHNPSWSSGFPWVFAFDDGTSANRSGVFINDSSHAIKLITRSSSTNYGGLSPATLF